MEGATFCKELELTSERGDLNTSFFLGLTDVNILVRRHYRVGTRSALSRVRSKNFRRLGYRWQTC
jgi:hypothetical protein